MLRWNPHKRNKWVNHLQVSLIKHPNAYILYIYMYTVCIRDFSYACAIFLVKLSLSPYTVILDWSLRSRCKTPWGRPMCRPWSLVQECISPRSIANRYDQNVYSRKNINAQQILEVCPEIRKDTLQVDGGGGGSDHMKSVVIEAADRSS